MNRIPIAALTLGLIAAGEVVAQPLSPSAHFGASTIPSRTTASYLGLSFDRFTPTGKVTEPGSYNGIDRTIGLNFLSFARVAELERWPSVTYQASLQLGWGHDQPTRWIQSSLHRLARLPPVETTDPRNNVLDAVVNLEAVRWSAAGASAHLFTGVGASVGTPHSEGWVQLGLTSPGGGALPALAASLRLGAPLLGGAFPDSTIADVYAAVEVRTDLPLGSWLGVAWLPSPFVALRRDTGFFVDLDGRRIPELHGSFGLVSSDGSWRIEAWNEYFGGRFQDIGPTGGGRVVVRLR